MAIIGILLFASRAEILPLKVMLVSELANVILVSSSLGVGGAERVLTTLANSWAEKGVDVRIIVLSLSKSFYPLDDRIKVQTLGLSGTARHFLHGFWMNLGRIMTLRRAIAAEHVEAVLSFGTETNIITILATIGLPCRIIVSERCDPEFYPDSRIWRALRRIVYPLADAIVAQTGRAAEYLSYWPRGKVVVIPNPVTLPRITGQTQIISSPFVLAVGRLVRQKGFDVLLEAFGHLVPSFPDWQLVILGSGEEQGPLSQQAEILEVDNKVHLLGVVESPSDFMAQAALFVLPSRFEGFPNVLGEAMASGLPVIAADCPSGPADIVRRDEDGLLIPPDDVDALALAMRQLMEDQGRRERLGEKARGITARFSLNNIVTAWEAILVSRGQGD